MQQEMDALNTAVSEIAAGANALATRHLEFLRQLDSLVTGILKDIEVYIHPNLTEVITRHHAAVQAMGESIQADAAALQAKIAPAHEALGALDRARGVVLRVAALQSKTT